MEIGALTLRNTYNENNNSSTTNIVNNQTQQEQQQQDRTGLYVDQQNTAEGIKNNRKPQTECQTCKNRKYQDGSNDPGVSFKTPTKMSPNQAATAVRAHEYEHVSREQSKARQEGKEVVNQNVSIHMSICPECGTAYVSGGTTTTTTREKKGEEQNQASDGIRGNLLDVNA